MVELDANVHAAPPRQASKLLFSHGRFERAKTSLPPKTDALLHVSENSTSSSACSKAEHNYSRRGGLVADRHCKGRRCSEVKEQQCSPETGFGREEVRDEEEGESSILHNFSVLAAGILAIWEGDDSVRRRIESLGERQQAIKDGIKTAEEVQRELKERLRALERRAEEEQASLERLREERMHTLAQGRATMTRSSADHHHNMHQHKGQENCKSNARKQHPHTVKALQAPDHEEGPVFSSWQIVAFEMLEFAHKRLTSHMWAHMCESVRAMGGEDEMGAYLGVFRGPDGTPFSAKPLSEATYAELLGFINSKLHAREELMEAMEAAERGLLEEAGREGYPCSSIGNVRNQMAVYLQCQRQFKAAAASFNRLQASCGRAAGLCVGYGDQKLTQDIISDTRRAAQSGQLGALQPASQLIQLGCYFLCKSSTTKA